MKDVIGTALDYRAKRYPGLYADKATAMSAVYGAYEKAQPSTVADTIDVIERAIRDFETIKENTI